MSLFAPKGGKGLKFPTPGTSYTGTITSEPVEQQQTKYGTDIPDTWPNGDPKMQILVNLDTQLREDADDDGRRTLYVASNKMKQAIWTAVTAAGVDDIKIGGTLTVTYSGNDPASKNPANPAKLYTASYVPPASPFAGEDSTAQAPQTGYATAHAPAPAAQQAAPAAAPAPAQQPAPPIAATPAAQPVDPWNPPSAPAPATAPAAAAGPDLSKLPALLAAGLDDHAIANALGTTPEVVAQARATA